MDIVKGIMVAVLLLPGGPVFPEQDAVATRCRMWMDVYSGEPIGYREMMEDLLRTDIIYIGEIHSLKRHHETQVRILEDICNNGTPVTLCLEQIESFNQAETDRYSRGEISFDVLAKNINWPERWSNYEDYRQVMETARRCGANIRALNVKEETARSAARRGLDGLTKEERKELPGTLPYYDPLYEKKVKRLLGVHAFADPDSLQFLYEAQAVRDGVMAFNVARAFSGRKDGKGIVVVIGGAAHFSHGLGVPSMTARHVPEARSRIILLSESGDLELSFHEKSMSRRIPNAHEDLRFLSVPIADYIEITGPAE